MGKNFAGMQKSADLSNLIRSFLRVYPRNNILGYTGRLALRNPRAAALLAGSGLGVGINSLHNIYRNNQAANLYTPPNKPLNPLGIKDPLNNP